VKGLIYPEKRMLAPQFRIEQIMVSALVQNPVNLCALEWLTRMGLIWKTVPIFPRSMEGFLTNEETYGSSSK
jgi:hypothetical protein